jgi:anaerobic C4-dicarboxylate transporter
MYFIAMVQTLNVNFVIPAQPTLLFAVNLDETGRTRATSFKRPLNFEHLPKISGLIIYNPNKNLIKNPTTIDTPIANIPPMYFIAMVQTLNVNFVIPAQPTLLFAVNLDETPYS